MEKRVYIGLLLFDLIFMCIFIIMGYILVIISPVRVETKFFYLWPYEPIPYYNTVFAGYISFLYAAFFGIFSLIVVILHQIERPSKKDDSNK
jgi:hypothetical protein